MTSSELRSGIETALADLEVTQAGLKRLLELIDQQSESAPAERADETKPVDITITGKVGRPKLTETANGIALWEAGLQLTNEHGAKEWINIQAWRKTAIYAGENLPSASIATAVGRYETEEWTDDKGVPHERRKFVVKHFVEQK